MLRGAKSGLHSSQKLAHRYLGSGIIVEENSSCVVLHFQIESGVKFAIVTGFDHVLARGAPNSNRERRVFLLALSADKTSPSPRSRRLTNSTSIPRTSLLCAGTDDSDVLQLPSQPTAMSTKTKGFFEQDPVQKVCVLRRAWLDVN